ncbi:hypothetical protein [Acetobacter vaccinii]|uniref:DUF3035 domain-containing protein n=1 Tax=Acetobacter vaccinii TaxID=2592655 RepID=A0A5C1YLS1_9PROT|nr:hypothetical protein [Acetobacter vaccinii]QEO16871.1 hypothetical protein FLP30_03155 [Acetobacter vaccinii]
MSRGYRIGRMLGLLALIAPLLSACHGEIEGENIDLPPERPGRFLPEAAEAEARAAQRDMERLDRQQREAEARNGGHAAPPPAPEDRYETLPQDAEGSAGPMRLENGHTIIPQTQAIYGRPAGK